MAKLTTVYCTDEDIAVRAGGDFALLCPRWQKLAYGTDGALAANSFTLTSASASFTGDVTTGHVVWLKKPTSSFTGSGELLAVDSVPTSTSLVLRRLGLDSGIGQPPSTSSVSSIEYVVQSLGPQIEEASFALNQAYRIDPAWSGRMPSDVYDLRDLRQACVLTVLMQRLQAEVQDKSDAAWALKLRTYATELAEVRSRLQLRWSQDDRRPATNWFGTRLVR